MIPMYLNQSLKDVLLEQGIDENNYGPAYGGESAGLDLYSTKDIEIDTFQKKVLVPTGLHLAVPKGWVALILDRGSMCKTDLVKRCGVIDAGFFGEIFVNLYTCASKTTIKRGEKLPVQIVCLPIDNEYRPLSKEEYDELTSDAKRGKGQIGSSDKS